LLRFVLPLFPDAAHSFAPIAMAIGAAGIVYGAWLAFAQTDLKRLLAYSSISHMGFVLLGIFAWNTWSLEGAIVQMVAHGVTIGALFLLVGIIQERLHTLDILQMGGLWSRAPRLSALLLVFAVSALGLPGLGNFVGEFLVIVGAYRASAPAAIAAACGVIFSALYALRMLRHTVFGVSKSDRPIADGSVSQLVTIGFLVAVIVWLGLFPQTALNAASQALRNMQLEPAAPMTVGIGAIGRPEVNRQEPSSLKTGVEP
jgi:NADH-quinone oxidoreductase subunit M